jgi:hypothetical protein
VSKREELAPQAARGKFFGAGAVVASTVIDQGHVCNGADARTSPRENQNVLLKRQIVVGNASACRQNVCTRQWRRQPRKEIGLSGLDAHDQTGASPQREKVKKKDALKSTFRLKNLTPARPQVAGR